MPPMPPMPKTAKFYRYHPETGIDANDLDSKDLTVEQKEELASMVRNGARFYWTDLGHPEQFYRCEWSNTSFVFKAAGIKPEVIETPPVAKSS